MFPSAKMYKRRKLVEVRGRVIDGTVPGGGWIG